MRRYFPQLILVVAAFATVSIARADHRVALLMGSETGNLEKLSVGLEKFGFRCSIIDTNEVEKLKNVVDGFALRTPTRGTAFVYFQGESEAAKADGIPSLDLFTPNSRQRYSLALLLEALNSKGGSATNLVFLDTSPDLSSDLEIPKQFQVTAGKTGGLISDLDRGRDLIPILKSSGETVSTLADNTVLDGPGSKSVAPPGQFILGTKAGDEWVNHDGIVFCWCPPGTYTAGSPENEPGRYDDETQREVVIENGFWMSKYELALSQNFRDFGRPPRNALGTHKLHPLTMVNYDDARGMTQRNHSEKERKAGRLPTDWEYSLCTEDQWEYAARAGSQSAYTFGDNPSLLPQHGNFADKSFFDTQDIYSLYGHRTFDDGAPRLALVGSFPPNSWGFHDMHGNVAEWCLGNAVRGGSWVNTVADCRIAHRHSYSSRNEQNFIGYRIVIRKVPKEGPNSKKP